MTRAVAVLRPEPGNARTAARVEAAGLRAIRLPLFAVAAVAWDAPDPAGYDAIAATSANAFRHGGAGLADLLGLPVFAVGEATAAAARGAGFAVEATGARDAAALARLAGGRRLLHLAGRDHHPLPNADARIVYASDPLPIALSEIEALAGTTALLHSARAGRRLTALASPALRRTMRLVAISDAAAKAVADGWEGVAAAVIPDDAAMIALAGLPSFSDSPRGE